jgi:sulfur carrier protein
MAVQITINGKKEQVKEGATIFEILKTRNIRSEIVAVEINGEIIDREEYPTTKLRRGDEMEYLDYTADRA